MPPTRRGLVATAAALLALRGQRARAAAAPVGALLRLLPDQRSAAIVGLAYLREQGIEPPAVQAFAASLMADLEAPGQGGAGLASAYDRRVTQDFTVGETVLVQGWMLSSTEARLCALAWLDVAGG